MKKITSEKILYHAKHNGAFTITSSEYNSPNMTLLIDNLLEHKFIRWETNELWQDYAGKQWESDYDHALHEYTITKWGEIRLAIMRVAYAHKNHKNEEKHTRRMEELLTLMNDASVTMYDLFNNPNWYNSITTSEYSALNYMDELNNSKPAPVLNTKDTNDVSFDEPVLNNMFSMSVFLGNEGTDSTRTEEYVLRKINEELGEMTLEMNIRDGLSYKKPGKDGVKGEAVDLAICAMDMFALQCPNMSPEEMEREFLSYMCVKLEKWKSTLGK